MKAILEEEGIPADIEVIKVRTDEEAKRLRFIGSPTIRIDGAEIEQGVEKRTDYGLKCRRYLQPMGDLIGWLRKETIQDVIRRRKLQPPIKGKGQGPDLENLA